jgi:hypothetical protein
MFASEVRERYGRLSSSRASASIPCEGALWVCGWPSLSMVIEDIELLSSDEGVVAFVVWWAFAPVGNTFSVAITGEDQTNSGRMGLF